MSEIFKLLTGGAQFNRKRFRNDFEVFQCNKTNNNGHGGSTKSGAPITANDKLSLLTTTAAAVHSELDFFNMNDTPVNSSSSSSSGSSSSTFNKAEDNASLKKARREDFDSSSATSIVNSTSDNPTDPKPIRLKSIEQANKYRKDHRIRVFGSDVPHPVTSFDDLCEQYSLRPFLKKGLESLSYSTPTPIQMQSIPIIMHNRDVIACAPTGSGKTLAFSIPILHDLKSPEKGGFRALILSPTRELAQQIDREIKALCGTKPFKICVLNTISNTGNNNAVSQYQNFDILITTPLRLVTAIKNESIKLHNVRHIVLDEADRLLDDGFLDQIDDILTACTNSKLQRSLYSATMPSGVETIANTFMKDAVRVIIGASNAATESINQKLLFVGQEEGKLFAIRQLIQQGGLKPPVLIFVQSIERAKQLFHELVYDNINVDVMHAERTKAQRDAIIQNFRTGKTWILIATELMSRGIDFKGVNLVINYDFPTTVQSYIHRIGRTGRAGRAGEAITYFTKDDAPYLKSIVNVMRESGCEVSDWMLKLKKPSKMLKQELKFKPIDRRQIKTTSKFDELKMKKKAQIVADSEKKNNKESIGK